MSENQEKFEGFPEDDALWCVKYIDQFSQAHGRTRSTAVTVMLQLLPFTDVAELAKLNAKDCQEFLRRPSKGAGHTYEFVQILVGCLPVVGMGAVFRTGVKVGELPSTLRRLRFLPGQSDSDDVEAGTLVDRPPKWDPKMPHRTLNSGEYAGIYNHSEPCVNFASSRLVVIRRRNGLNTDVYVIPRMTIFRSFYAQHSEIVKAFCAGPWSSALEDLICLNDLDSGLKTEETDGGACWNIILQTLVPDDYVSLLAVFMFDPYGRAHAESIYATSLKDRKGVATAPWFASARIPLRAVEDALVLNAKCIELKSRFHFDEENMRCETRKFLVTEICGSSWPSHYPEIGHERTNSGLAGLTGEKTDQPEPYRGQRRGNRNGDATTTVSQEHDAHKDSSTKTLRGHEWNWIGRGPVLKKLKKLTSKRYEASASAPDEDGSRISAGAHTRAQDGLPKAEAKTLIRVPNERFEHISDALDALDRSGIISRLRPVRPHRIGQAGERNGRPCWKFIDDVSLRRGGGPRRGWRSVYQGPRGRHGAHWRTAMIFRFDINGSTYYWVEIECRPSDSFKSTMLANVVGNIDAILQGVLEVIADGAGRDLETRLTNAFAHEQICVATYTHHYPDGPHALSLRSVSGFIERAVNAFVHTID